MNIIAFAGQARAGKTTMARAFGRAAAKLDMKPIYFSFADPIKDEAAKAGIDRETDPLRYREFCQNFGRTMREQNPDYWVEAMSKRLEKAAKADSVHLEKSVVFDTSYYETTIIIDDLRYENEYDFIKKLGGHVLLVVRPGLPDPNAEWRGHESEEFGNYWTSQDTDNLAGVFSGVIINDADTPDDKDIDAISNHILSFLTAEAFDPSMAIEEDDSELSELARLMRELRKAWEKYNNDDSTD